MTDVDPERLRVSPLFSGLGADDLEAVASLLGSQTYGKGRSIVREGDIGYDFFVIAAGEADVTHEATVLGRLGPGDFFGELGIASSDGKRTATVTARTDVEVWTMYGSAVQRLQREHPHVTATLAAAVRERATDG
jgi:CRP-like cAMP-binding protein